MEMIESVKTLTQSLKDDPDFYYAYQANIAMAFKDEFKRRGLAIAEYCNGDEVLHDVANQAAKNFLNLWIGISK